jgi:chromosome partitioning protein
MPRVVGVVNYKGGTGKTTTAAHLAHAWAEVGRSVVVVDADPQGSALTWSELGEWPLPVIGLAVRDLHRRLPGIVGDRYDLVVIDTPPMDERAGIVHAVLRAADVAVVPAAPSMIEVSRLSLVWDAIAEVDPLRFDPLPAVVLLTRVIAQASSTRVVRDLIEQSGHRVLDIAIPRLERYAQSYGAPVRAAGDAYAAAAYELDGIR